MVGQKQGEVVGVFWKRGLKLQRPQYRALCSPHLVCAYGQLYKYINPSYLRCLAQQHLETLPDPPLSLREARRGETAAKMHFGLTKLATSPGRRNKNFQTMFCFL